jgi:hypothetical protein
MLFMFVLKETNMRFVAWLLALSVLAAYVPGCTVKEYDHHHDHWDHDHWDHDHDHDWH